MHLLKYQRQHSWSSTYTFFSSPIENVSPSTFILKFCSGHRLPQKITISFSSFHPKISPSTCNTDAHQLSSDVPVLPIQSQSQKAFILVDANNKKLPSSLTYKNFPYSRRAFSILEYHVGPSCPHGHLSSTR